MGALYYLLILWDFRIGAGILWGWTFDVDVTGSWNLCQPRLAMPSSPGFIYLCTKPRVPIKPRDSLMIGYHGHDWLPWSRMVMIGYHGLLGCRDDI